MGEEPAGGALDPAALERLRRLGGEDLVREMAGLFLRLGAERLAAARQGLAGDDPAAVERAAHSLKSSAGNVGAGGLLEAAERAERTAEAVAGSGGGAAELPALVGRMEAEFARAAGELRERVAGIEDPEGR